jgi:hypothetical protein
VFEESACVHLLIAAMLRYLASAFTPKSDRLWRTIRKSRKVQQNNVVMIFSPDEASGANARRGRGSGVVPTAAIVKRALAPRAHGSVAFLCFGLLGSFGLGGRYVDAHSGQCGADSLGVFTFSIVPICIRTITFPSVARHGDGVDFIIIFGQPESYDLFV